jgi:ankyrin repeat protein
MLALFVDSGADVNVAVEYPFGTAMQWAIYADKEISVQFLLEHGANPNFAGSSPVTPLGWALSKPNLKIARLLIKHGANVDTACASGATPLALAIERNNRAAFELLLASGANPKAINPNGETLLMVAIGSHAIQQSGVASCAIEDSLLARGVDINASNHLGQTALIYAAWLNDSQSTRYLLLHGADPELVDQNGGSPLLYLAQNIHGRDLKIWLSASSPASHLPDFGATYRILYNTQQNSFNLALGLGFLLLVSLTTWLQWRRACKFEASPALQKAIDEVRDAISMTTTWQKDLAEFERVQNLSRPVRKARFYVRVTAISWILAAVLYPHDPLLLALYGGQGWWLVCGFTLLMANLVVIFFQRLPQVRARLIASACGVVLMTLTVGLGLRDVLFVGGVVQLYGLAALLAAGTGLALVGLVLHLQICRTQWKLRDWRPPAALIAAEKANKIEDFDAPVGWDKSRAALTPDTARPASPAHPPSAGKSSSPPSALRPATDKTESL